MSAVYPDRPVSLKSYPKFKNLQVFFMLFFLLLNGLWCLFCLSYEASCWPKHKPALRFKLRRKRQGTWQLRVSHETPFPSLMRLKNQGIVNWTPLFQLHLHEQTVAPPLSPEGVSGRTEHWPALPEQILYRNRALGFADNLSHGNLVFLP